ncbi:MAG: hypothetical protein H3Z51_02645, partial [archaeon]|nr:hypothetical protein [archaeon]
YGVYNAGIDMTNAENNWWGSMDGPGGVGPVTPDGVGPGSGDEVTALVDYIPWLTAIIP